MSFQKIRQAITPTEFIILMFLRGMAASGRIGQRLLTPIGPLVGVVTIMQEVFRYDRM
jgi:hypothetical protein